MVALAVVGDEDNMTDLQGREEASSFDSKDMMIDQETDDIDDFIKKKRR